MRQQEVTDLVKKAIVEVEKALHELHRGNIGLTKRVARLERELAREHDAPHLNERPITPPKYPSALLAEIGISKPIQ